MRDFIYLVVLPIVSLAAFVFAFLLLIWWVQSSKCEARWEGARQIEWSVFGGCRVMSNGEFVPEDRVWYERNS